ncbi:MAG: ABC transporter ATP-binding protein [Acidimicrobiales bacterium]
MALIGGGGGGVFGAHGGGKSAANPGAGLPFAGVPSEMVDGIRRLVGSEPDHGDPAVTYTARPTDRRPLTLRRMVAPYRGALALTAMLVVLETIALQAGPLLTQLGIDHGILPGDVAVLVAVAIAYVVSVVGGAVASGFRVALAGRVASWVMNDLRNKVFSHLQRLSLDFYTNEKAGVIMTRMTSDIEALQQLLQDGVVQFAIQGLTMAVVTVVLFSYNVELAIITLFLVVPILTVLSLWFRSASERGYGRVRDGLARVLSDLQESLAGVRVVSSYNRQRHNVIHHRNVVGEYRDANNYTAHINGVYGPAADMIGVLAQAVLLLIGGRMVLRGELTIGQLTAFVLYLGSFFLPIQQLVQLYNTYQQGQAAVVKLRELLATEPSVAEAADAVDLPAIHGEIVLDDVSFGYSPRVPVVEDVNLHIANGETIAFVGPTGAGKSTLAKLVTRLYDPTAGRVLIDGHDIRTVTLESLHRQIGVVPQEPFLFVGSIRDNLAFARPDVTDDEIAETIERVGLDALVDRLPRGVDTVVHERGQSLSSGERQLIALARAFLARPRILVLDEATSNLDPQSEIRVEHALDALLDGRTAILIAHRLSTAMRADRIVVIDQGGVVEVGTHRQLVERRGHYAAMYETWMSHAEPAA